MSLCTDTKVGELLHAWELGMLGEDERRRVELHLLECGSCREQARRMSEAAREIQQSRSARELAGRYSGKPAAGPVKYLLAAVLVLALALPFYLYFVTSEDSVNVGQHLYLMSVRSSDDRTIDMNIEGSVEIHFRLPAESLETVFSILITSRAGDTVFVDDDFNSFDSLGVGTIILPVESFKQGFYALFISAGDSDIVRYNFNSR